MRKYALAAAVMATVGTVVRADVSAPATLQWFESSYSSMQKKMPDFFMAGYGGIWTPPPGRADSGNQSVGYDQYDRFDLGSPGNSTLYGTETGLKTTINELHKEGGSMYVDLVWNHDGYRDSSTTGFQAQGGYPGFVLSWPGTSDGDFHSAYASGDQDGRLAGLIDIDQSQNIQLIRSPVPGYANNIPGGTVANIPTTANLRFYPDTSLQPISVYDPTTGQMNIKIYPFNNANPSAGTPVAENDLGYLMRNAQWLVQSIGADGFRLDATKNYPSWVLNYFDRAVYRSSFRTLLDGSQEQIFSFGEYFDTNMSSLQSVVKKNIDSNNPGTIGGNRDTLDFPLYYAMQSNLTNNGVSNNWNNVINASFDINDDGYANNGSQGVSFVQSADSGAPYLSNVAYAFTLMRPGNAIVYFNAHEFGTNRSFPNDGRGDALGGQYGTTITKLVDIRKRYGSGNFIPRDTEKETLIFERQDSIVVGLSNRLDAGYDSRTVQTSFAAGTPLIELTGNAADPTVDPNNDIPDVVIVNNDGTINFRVPRNVNVNGVEHDKGYVIYGPSGPQGTLSETNIAQTLAPDTQNSTNNGTTRVTPIHVIKNNSFNVSLQTQQVTLLGSIRDANADGDNALIKVDGGLDVNNNGHVDFTTPGTTTYGFETFATKSSPLIGGGDGQFIQTVDTTKLSEGLHYIDVIAFRHRNSGEPAVYSEFKDVIYIDRMPPISVIDNFNPTTSGQNENRTVEVNNTDFTGNNVHVLMDIGSAVGSTSILNMLGSSTQANQTDTNLWTKNFTGVTSGNHVFTIVTYEMDGNFNIQRYPGYSVSSIYGAGLGDLNNDGLINSTDISLFTTLYNGHNSSFNPAADFDADGVITPADVYAMGQKLISVGASPATINAYNTQLLSVVPEPSVVGILFVGGVGIVGSRRRRRN